MEQFEYSPKIRKRAEELWNELGCEEVDGFSYQDCLEMAYEEEEFNHA